MQYMYMYMDAFYTLNWSVLTSSTSMYIILFLSSFLPLSLSPPLPRVFLNKLSPHKFKNLAEHARELEINTK